jgi:hypothetical protein
MHTLAEETSPVAAEVAAMHTPAEEALRPVDARLEPIVARPKQDPLEEDHNSAVGHREAASLEDFARAFPAQEANRDHNFAASYTFS